jgi:hypothetical protein
MANMTDCRDLDATGWEIPSENYCDQPYVVKTDDGAWLCQMTTGHSREGQPGEHVVSMRSEDQGKTWADLVALEPADGPEAAYGVLLKAPSGRIFCFYNHNTDNALEFTMSDIRGRASWKSDKGKIETGKSHHVVIIVDGGPQVMAFVIDGVLCKGGNRKFGWGRFRHDFRDPNGADELRIGDEEGLSIEALRIYDRPLRVSEAMANFRVNRDN